MRKYKYMSIIVLEVYWFILFCSNPSFWSDFFHKEYLMVLTYLKGSSLYILVLFMVNVLVS
jgi:hypothetical protein